MLGAVHPVFTIETRQILTYRLTYLMLLLLLQRPEFSTSGNGNLRKKPVHVR